MQAGHWFGHIRMLTAGGYLRFCAPTSETTEGYFQHALNTH